MSNISTERFYQIKHLMDEAFGSSDYAKAEQLAIEYLDLAQSNQNDWNYGNAIHHANLTLGRLALKNGKLEKAKIHLIKAGKTNGSPQLNSFGPNMQLAKELLEVGESEVVIKYINLSKRFWFGVFSWRKTRQWKKAIVPGVVPDFGAHLDY